MKHLGTLGKILTVIGIGLVLAKWAGWSEQIGFWSIAVLGAGLVLTLIARKQSQRGGQ